MKNVLILIGLSATAFGGTLYVDADAGETRTGSWWRPFKSILEAQSYIHDARVAKPNEAWTVKVAKGDYFISEPLTFTEQDSNVTWLGKGARIIGAKKLIGWRNDVINGRQAFSTTVPGNDWFETMFVNGKRATRARLPSQGFFNPTKTVQTAFTNASPKWVTFKTAMTGRAEDLVPLAAAPKDELKFAHLVVHHNWDTTRRIIVDFKDNTIFTQGESQKKWNMWKTNSLYYVENVASACDEPGEWFFNGETRRITYIPREGEQAATLEVFYPVQGLGSLVNVAGDDKKQTKVRNIIFDGIEFMVCDSPRDNGVIAVAHLPNEMTKYGQTQRAPAQAVAWSGAAIVCDWADGITFRNCAITRTGEYALWFRNGCVNCRAEKCRMTDLGAGGVRIGPNSRGSTVTNGVHVTPEMVKPADTAFNVVDNCIIRHGGRVHAPGVGVWIAGSPFNSITHCEISDFYYTGVSIGWVWGYRGSFAQGNTLAFCRIRDIGHAVLADMGGVYTLGTSYGTCISNNVIYNVDSFSYGGWGLYPDEGSEGIVMENNLVYDTKDASFHQHYGKNNILRNNILAFSRQGQVAVTRAEPHLSVSVERNIILWNDGPVFSKYGGTLKEKAKLNWIGNIWWQQSGEPNFNGKTFAEWQAKGNDKEGAVADPLFVDAAKRDFRLRKDSPVVRLGFKPFDISAAGVYGDSDWKDQADK